VGKVPEIHLGKKMRSLSRTAAREEWWYLLCGLMWSIVVLMSEAFRLVCCACLSVVDVVRRACCSVL
jgi:hypothetical protein